MRPKQLSMIVASAAIAVLLAGCAAVDLSYEALSPSVVLSDSYKSGVDDKYKRWQQQHRRYTTSKIDGCNDSRDWPGIDKKAFGSANALIKPYLVQDERELKALRSAQDRWNGKGAYPKAPDPWQPKVLGDLKAKLARLRSQLAALEAKPANTESAKRIVRNIKEHEYELAVAERYYYPGDIVKDFAEYDRLTMVWLDSVEHWVANWQLDPQQFRELELGFIGLSTKAAHGCHPWRPTIAYRSSDLPSPQPVRDRMRAIVATLETKVAEYRPLYARYAEDQKAAQTEHKKRVAAETHKANAAKLELADAARQKLRAGFNGWQAISNVDYAGASNGLIRFDHIGDAVVQMQAFCVYPDGVPMVTFAFLIDVDKHSNTQIRQTAYKWLADSDQRVAINVSMDSYTRQATGDRKMPDDDSVIVNEFHFGFLDIDAWHARKTGGALDQLRTTIVANNAKTGRGYLTDKMPGVESLSISARYTSSGGSTTWQSSNLAPAFRVLKDACFKAQ